MHVHAFFLASSLLAAQADGANTQGTPQTPPASDAAAMRQPAPVAAPSAPTAPSAPSTPATPAAPSAPVPAAAPAVPAAPVAPPENALEANLNKLPPFFWDKDQPLEVRITRFSNFVMFGAGLLALAAAVGFLCLTATIQLAPIPDSDPRERPRSTFAIASMVTTTLLFISGTVAVLGSLFALFAI
jgi:hypothetical protein